VPPTTTLQLAALDALGSTGDSTHSSLSDSLSSRLVKDATFDTCLAEVRLHTHNLTLPLPLPLTLSRYCSMNIDPVHNRCDVPQEPDDAMGDQFTD